MNRTFFALLLLTLCLAGCHKQEADPNANAGAKRILFHEYFHTHFQDESQFIVESIVTDVAEMAYYAKQGTLPATESFIVDAREKPSSPVGKPTYHVEIKFGAPHRSITLDLTVSDAIWAPQVYRPVVQALFTSFALTGAESQRAASDTLGLLSSLRSLTAVEIEKQNREISDLLTLNFKLAELHERAALVLGAFALREQSGDFFDIRSPLCRMTAHLALATGLGAHQGYSINGRVAEAILYALMNNQQAALERVSKFDQSQPVLAAWGRALKARVTGDFRGVEKVQDPSLLERIECFRALCHSADPQGAWNSLGKADVQKTPDFCRIANGAAYSVGTGHQLLGISLPLEIIEIGQVYTLSRGSKLEKERLVEALNELPERCFETRSNDTVQVLVIGWGQWAMFLQRHLCHALQENFDFLERKWGVHDEAKTFNRKTDETFAQLRLYPFVQRFNCTDILSYHRSVDAGLAATVATPHLISPEIWNYLCYTVPFAPLYTPRSNPHINEWHKHNPPPGTAYYPLPRMNHPSLVNRPDTVSRLEQLHALAPYDREISFNLLRIKYKEKATFEQIEAIYRPVLDFASGPLYELAEKLITQPAQYEQMLSKAAAMRPAFYYTLGEYFADLKNDQKAAFYLEKGIELGGDAVAASYRAGWLIKYYQRMGENEKAQKLADFAGEVYSHRGLTAKAEFLEATERYREAFEWYAKIEERYEDSTPLVAFCVRYKATTGDKRFDREAHKRLSKLFPSGLERIARADLKAAPADGLVLNKSNRLTSQWGLKNGDVIVALQGIRVHNLPQYNYAREASTNSQLCLIIWRDKKYLDLQASPPERRFGGDFAQYSGKASND